MSSFLLKKFYSSPRKAFADLPSDYISTTRVLHHVSMYDSLNESDFCCSFTKEKEKLLHSINLQFRFLYFTRVSVCKCRLRLLGVRAVFSSRMLPMKHFFIEAGGFLRLLGDNMTNYRMNVQKRLPFLRTHPVVTVYRYTCMR